MTRPDWRRKFSDVELAFIKRRKRMPRRELHAEFIEAFGRADISIRSIKRICQLNGWRTGRTGRFEKSNKNEHLDKYGYVRFYDGKRFVAAHRILWERVNGPIPAGYKLKCKGDRANCDPSNWEIIPNGLISRLYKRGYEAAAAELKPTIMAVAKLEHIAASRGK